MVLDDVDDEERRKRRSKKQATTAASHRPTGQKWTKGNVFGEIPGYPVGTTWATRYDCCYNGVHRATVRGIHGNAKDGGVFSIAVSGGYEDDVDLGTKFTYTGEGGRDLKGTAQAPKNLRTAPQSKDQQLINGNLALKTSYQNGKPIRVIRGYKGAAPYAPLEGYRYDGLYQVKKIWQDVGLSGHSVWKFAFVRCPGQSPPPWEATQEDDEEEDDEE